MGVRPNNKDYSILGSILGSPILGNSHVSMKLSRNDAQIDSQGSQIGRPELPHDTMIPEANGMPGPLNAGSRPHEYPCFDFAHRV